MGSAPDYKFEGWTAHDASSIEGNMKWQEIKPKGWEETDVDIKVTHCGMCGSDLHFLNNGWVSQHRKGGVRNTPSPFPDHRQGRVVG